MPGTDFQLETPYFLHDWPLRNHDRAYFYFDEYARTLARLVACQHTRTPLTICLSGPWGSGKTTLMRRFRKMLDESRCLDQNTKPEVLSFCNPNEVPQEQFRACRTVWFDAWKYAGEDHILAALLRVIVNQMQEEGFLQAIKAHLTGPKNEEMRWIGVLLNALAGFASAGSFDFNLEDFQMETPFKTASAFFDYFDTSLTRLIASWVHCQLISPNELDDQKGVLVIFIDDLDRCLPAKTVEVLEAIKLFLDKMGCVFVLGADIDVIQQAVASHYHDSGVTGEIGRDYLDKIIQLRFSLPPILGDVMKTYLEVERCADDTILNNWQVLMAGADVNPRRVKALINEINLEWAILRNIGQAETINRGDFVCWSILARSAPVEFIRQLRDIGDLDSPELQRKYIDDLLAWASGRSLESEQQFKQYQPYKRFRLVLRAIKCFSNTFDAAALNSFLHMVSPRNGQGAKPAPIDAALGLLSAASRTEMKVIRPKNNQEGLDLPLVKIPRGKFVMGSRDDNTLAHSDEQPQQTFDIPYDYWISRYLITNEQFEAFLRDTVPGYPVNGGPERGTGYPVVNVDWNTALRFCRWITQYYQGDDIPEGYCFTLPSEPEWEKAARGLYGNEWPWGNEFFPDLCNTREGTADRITPVGSYSPIGDSPFGCADMAGDVWEWTRSGYKPYPYEPGDGREELSDLPQRVMRGGSWSGDRGMARCACRDWGYPDGRYSAVAFRLVIIPESCLYPARPGG
jgi:gamma-glutamyl hercynylcysteine S-oxide synthase